MDAAAGQSQIANQIQDLVPSWFFWEAKLGGNWTVGPKNQHVPFTMMSPQTSLPKRFCFFFKTERSSGGNLRGKSLWRQRQSHRLTLDAAIIQTIVTAVVQVVHDFEATGFGRRQSDQGLLFGFCRQVLRMKHRGRLILLDDANFQNGFNKHLGGTIKARRLG